MKTLYLPFIVTWCIVTCAVGCTPQPPPPGHTPPSISVTRTTPIPTSTSPPKAGDSIASVPVGDQPADLAYGEASVWVANAGSGTVSRIDPTTNSVTAEISIGEVGGDYGSPTAVAVGNGSIWVTDNTGFAIVRVDPFLNKVVERIRLEMTQPDFQRQSRLTNWLQVWKPCGSQR